MKACDKQWAETIEAEPRYIPSISPHEMFEMGWRAVLEFLKEHITEEGTYPRGTSGYELAEDLKEVIEQELED